MTSFDTRVKGIPCVVQVVHYQPAIQGRFSGPPEDCYPSEPAEFDFELYSASRRYSRMRWLERKLTQADIDQIQDEFEASVTANKHGIDF